MKIFTLLLFLIFFNSTRAETFQNEASLLADTLKKSLMTQVKEKLNAEGAVEAVKFCHANVRDLAKSAAGKYLNKYEFGRTALRVRNSQNKPQDWMKPYLDKFQHTTSSRPAKAEVIVLKDGKKAYLEPIYLQGMCLNCHGSNVSSGVSQKIKELYPDDKATGFRVGEFRGIIWVKEK